MNVVTFRLVFVRLWLTARFALAINLVTGCRHSFQIQIVQNLRVLGELEADRASLHVIVQNLPQRLYEDCPPFWQQSGSLCCSLACCVDCADSLGGRLLRLSCCCLDCSTNSIPLLPSPSADETWILPNASLTDSSGNARSLPVAIAMVRPPTKHPCLKQRRVQSLHCAVQASLSRKSCVTQFLYLLE